MHINPQIPTLPQPTKNNALEKEKESPHHVNVSMVTN